MSLYSQHDSLPLPLNSLYYDLTKRLTDPSPRLVDGSSNFFTSYKNSICTRPGFDKLLTTVVSATPTNYVITRMWLYDGPYNTYLFASMLNTSVFGVNLYYLKLNDTTPTWTQVSTLRGLNVAFRHEGAIYKDKFYVRFSPWGTSDKYTAVIIYENISGIQCVPWGVPKPTVPARMKGVTSKITSGTVTTGATAFTIADATGMPATPFSLWVGLEEMTVTGKAGTIPCTLTVTRAINGTAAESYPTGTRVYWKNFATSDNQVNVDRGWRYSYGWKSITNHVSSAAPVEFNPDLMPSETGRFKNLKPKVIVQGHADTTNFPKIVIFRSTNGGGNLFVADEITNTGAGDIEYEDKNQASGPTSSVFNDPTLDGKLVVLAPDDTSNDPPPMVNAPLVTGTASPVASTGLVVYANRIWFAIENILYYSSNEELNSGVPQEAFDSSILKGNFITFEHNIMDLQASQDGLLVKTDRDTHIISGSTKDTFSPVILIPGIGGWGPHNPTTAPNYNTNASCKIGNGDVWVTNTGAVVIRHNGSKEVNVISNALSTLINFNVYDLKYVKTSQYEWIVMILVGVSAGYNNQSILIFDLKHYEANGRNPNISSWYPPWIGMNPSTLVFGYVPFGTELPSTDGYRLLVASYGLGTTKSHITYMNPSVMFDSLLNASNVPTVTNFASKLKTNYLMPLTGNHFNDLIVSSAYIPFKTLLVEKVYQGIADTEVVKYSSDFGSQVTVTNFGTSLIKPQPNTTNLINLYKYDIDIASRRIQFELSYSADGRKVDIENLVPIWRAGSNVSSD